MTSIPTPPQRPPVPDRWHTRELPFLVEIARALDSRQRIDADAIAADLGMTQDDIDAAWHALREAGYLRAFEGRPRRLADDVWSHIDLTERGRRAVGLWPSDKAADSLVDLLRQAADLTDDPEEKTRLRQAAGALLSLSRDILTDVGAAWVRAQTGL